jgi:hypothetical protein
MWRIAQMASYSKDGSEFTRANLHTNIPLKMTWDLSYRSHKRLLGL